MIEVGDKVFFELDDMEGVDDLTSGKEYEIVSAGDKCPEILNDEGENTPVYWFGLAAVLDYRASWEKVQNPALLESPHE